MSVLRKRRRAQRWDRYAMKVWKVTRLHCARLPGYDRAFDLYWRAR